MAQASPIAPAAEAVAPPPPAPVPGSSVTANPLMTQASQSWNNQLQPGGSAANSQGSASAPPSAKGGGPQQQQPMGSSGSNVSAAQGNAQTMNPTFGLAMKSGGGVSASASPKYEISTGKDHFLGQTKVKVYK